MKNKIDQLVGFILGLIFVVICYFLLFGSSPSSSSQSAENSSPMPIVDRSYGSGIDVLRLSELQMSAVKIDMHRYLGWFPDDKVILRQASLKAASRAMRREGCQVHILTNRPKGTEDEIRGELDACGVSYDVVKITADKAKYIQDQEIDVFFDDTDEYFIDLPDTVAVFKPREPGNFDFDQKKWVYGPKTGYRA